jgi:hypothetical protein
LLEVKDKGLVGELVFAFAVAGIIREQRKGEGAVVEIFSGAICEAKGRGDAFAAGVVGGFAAEVVDFRGEIGTLG